MKQQHDMKRKENSEKNPSPRWDFLYFSSEFSLHLISCCCCFIFNINGLRNIFLLVLSSRCLLNIGCGDLLRLRNIALIFGVHIIFRGIFSLVVTFLYLNNRWDMAGER